MSEKKSKSKNAPAPKFDHSAIPSGDERMVPVKDLLLSKTFQPRSGLDEETIEEYAEEIKSGDFPCIEVVVVDDKMYVVDGFHRVEAAREAKLKDIRAIVRKGSKHLAQWMAASSNRKHGLRRTNADKRRAVKMALQAAPDASLREIAEHCGVSHELVRLVKDPPAQDKPKAPRPEKSGPEYVAPPTPQGEHDPKSKENARQVLVGLLGECETLRARFNSIAKTPAGTFLSMQTAMSEIDNLKSCIKSAMPHGLCIYCNGEGCTNCKKLGWMSERMFATAPKSLKSGTK
jgi:hypothetical protein